MDRFEGRVAVVTGGGTGMGRELVRQLAAEGCHVAMCDVSEENMAQTKGRLFARWSRGASFAQWGDFNTATGAYGTTGARSLGEYSRTLNGWLQRYESDRLRLSAFAHQGGHRYRHKPIALQQFAESMRGSALEYLESEQLLHC